MARPLLPLRAAIGKLAIPVGEEPLPVGKSGIPVGEEPLPIGKLSIPVGKELRREVLPEPPPGHGDFWALVHVKLAEPVYDVDNPAETPAQGRPFVAARRL